jgi:hypothetical protein
MKKQAREDAYLNMNEFQLRYFFLDLTQGTFKYGKQPNTKQKVIAFKDIHYLSLDPQVVKGEIDRNYSCLFKLCVTGRNVIFGAKSLADRQLWVNGFTVIFELREHQNKRLEALNPNKTGLSGNYNTIGGSPMKQRSQSHQPNKKKGGLGDFVSSLFGNKEETLEKKQKRRELEDEL